MQAKLQVAQGGLGAKLVYQDQPMTITAPCTLEGYTELSHSTEYSGDRYCLLYQET